MTTPRRFLRKAQDHCARPELTRRILKALKQRFKGHHQFQRRTQVRG